MTAPPRRLHPIGEVLDLHGDGEVAIEPLVAAVRAGDVELGVFTDEELHWTGPDADADPPGFLDAPRLSRLDRTARDAALAATMWMLIARGQAAWDGQRLRLRGVHAMVADVRHDADAVASVQVEQRDLAAQASLAAVYRMRPDLFAVEYVAPEGLHHLVCCAPATAASRLAALVDPLRQAHTTGLASTASHAAGLEPTPDALAAQAASAAFVQLAQPAGHGAVAERAVTVYATGDGVFAYHGVTSADGAATLAVQRLGPDDLVGMCAGFLAPGGAV